MTPGDEATGPLLAIDPGREKTGMAMLAPDGGILARTIVPSASAGAAAADWTERWSPGHIVVGRGTGAREVRRALRQAGLSFTVIPEDGTTLAARSLYFADHPPRGWRRWVPLSLQVPPVPVDDYAAARIGQGYLAAQRAAGEGEGAGDG